jgi:hypothetical protein
MKFRNRNQKWSEEDVWILTRLMRDHVPSATIAAVLGRTEASLRHAIKNTLYQQLLHHMPSDVLMYYRMENEELYEDIVNPVYYQEIVNDDSQTEVDDEAEESDEETEDTEGENRLVTPSNRVCDYMITSVMSVLIAAGLAVYYQLVKEHWN